MHRAITSDLANPARRQNGLSGPCAGPAPKRPAIADGPSSAPAAGAYAARTVSRNLPTSCFSLVLSRDSVCAADSTWLDAEPVSVTPCWTSTMLDETY
jgi:hypothetical protein